jgi:Bacterial regulatory proteins, gntR family
LTAAYPDRARHAQVVHGPGARIVRGGLAPGDAMPTEDELVIQLHVVRSALREGVKVLAGKGPGDLGTDVIKVEPVTREWQRQSTRRVRVSGEDHEVLLGQVNDLFTRSRTGIFPRYKAYRTGITDR